MTFSRRVEAHLEQFLGTPARLSSALAGDVAPSFRIATYNDQPADDALTLVTIGISDSPAGTPSTRQEFLICAWRSDVCEALYDSLFAIGHELQTSGTAAEYGALLELPVPIVEQGPEHLLAYSPTYFDPELEDLPGEEPVEIVWLLPLVRSEAVFLQHHGLRALERKFEKHDPDLLDLRRKGVV